MDPTQFFTYTLNTTIATRIAPATVRPQRVVISLPGGGSANVSQIVEETRLAGGEGNTTGVYRVISPTPTVIDVPAGESLFATGSGSIRLSIACGNAIDRPTS